MKNILLRLASLAPLIAVTACTATHDVSNGSFDAASGRHLESGHASWYGPGFHGRRTASGETFRSDAMTAAHRSLPFGTRVRVVHEGTGRSVIVRINDRGPFHRGRIIDLAQGPARSLGLVAAGSAYVALHRLD